MRNYQTELENRIAFIQNQLRQSGADGIVLGLSGGKDSALVGILCKKACDNTVGLILPCMSKRNYEMDREDACSVASQYSISLRTVDLSAVKSLLLETISASGVNLSDMASANISPRLRMLTLYAVAASENRLVAGTGNRSEAYMGYFTKWGDGAHDFNPIADLTVTEIYEFLDYLGAPRCVMERLPRRLSLRADG
jgi:NAD+ synthase